MAITGSGSAVEVVPAITAGAYTAGKVMGGVMTFANILPANFNGILESITLKFKASLQTGTFAVALFSAPPLGTFVDESLPSIAAGDSALLIGMFSLATAQSNLGTHTIYELDGIAKQIVASSTSLYAVVIAVGAPTNPASVSDMSLQLGLVV